MISIRQAEASDASNWDKFVLDHEDSTFFHRYGWSEVLGNTYKAKSYFLIAENNAKIEGILPLVYLSSPFFGKSLISTSFTVGGGVLSNSDDALVALLKKAAELGEELGVAYVELRGGKAPDWISKTETYAGFVAQIPSEEDENLKLIPRKKRADVRKGIKALAEGKLSVELTDENHVWPLYAESVRNLGTPVFPKKLLTALKNTFADDVEMSFVKHGVTPVAGLVSFYHKDTVLPYYGGAIPAARGLHAYDLMYWCQMRRAVERGCTKFDFGRSKFGTGAFDFKKYWGFEPEALAYHYHLVKADAVPDINPNNPKFKMISETWQKLPLPVANKLGPILARNLA